MDKMTQQQPQSFRGRMFRRENARPREQRILVLRTGIAGAQFHIKGEEEQKALDSLAPGTELMLYREPDNKYDEWAVAVYRTEEDLLGYISRYKNETIARLMDAGKKFVAVVDDPEDPEVKKHMNREQRRTDHAPTENMSLPFSVYLVEDA